MFVQRSPMVSPQPWCYGSRLSVTLWTLVGGIAHFPVVGEDTLLSYPSAHLNIQLSQANWNILKFLGVYKNWTCEFLWFSRHTRSYCFVDSFYFNPHSLLKAVSGDWEETCKKTMCILKAPVAYRIEHVKWVVAGCWTNVVSYLTDVASYWTSVVCYSTNFVSYFTQ